MNVMQNSRNKSSAVRFDDFSKVIVAGGRQPPRNFNSASSELPLDFTPNFLVPGSVKGTPAFRHSARSDSCGVLTVARPSFAPFVNQPPSRSNLFGPTLGSDPISPNSGPPANRPSQGVFKTPNAVNSNSTANRPRRFNSSSTTSGNSSSLMENSSSSKLKRLDTLRRYSASSTTHASTGFRFDSTPLTSTTLRTPRTSSSSLVDSSSPRVVVAITEGRGHRRYEVGMAAMDINRPSLVLSQISDTPTYGGTLAKIDMFDPIEIVIPHTIGDGRQSQQLFDVLRNKIGNIPLSSAHRRLFDNTKGLQLISSLCLPEYEACQVLFKDKYFALAAANALLRYVEMIRLVTFAGKSLKVEYQGAEHGTLIGRKTIEDLELISNRDDGSKKNTLLSVLDKCLTIPGARSLRANILQPSCSQDVISERLDCVQELVADDHLLENIRRVLQSLPDVSQLLTLCMQAPPNADHNAATETRFNRVLTLKTTLQTIPAVAVTLQNVQSPWLVNVTKVLKDRRIEDMLKQISDVLCEDACVVKGPKKLMLQRSFAVKSGINELLDVTRQYFTQLIVEMQEYVEDLSTKYDIPLKVHCTATRGYHIQMQIPKKFRNSSFQLPEEFLQVQRTRCIISCTTEFMCTHNDRLKNLALDLVNLSDKILKPLVDDLRKQMGCLYRLSEVIAELDMIAALAVVSRSPNFTRPGFDKHLAVIDSMHPILNVISSSEIVPNDVFASEDSNFSLITGPNMSGKSIYLRQILILQIMAQVGCYVPAKQATFRIADRIFSRLRFEDEIDKEAGALVAELREISLMMKTFSSRSIVALDECCQGTSVEEGIPLAWALSEAFVQTQAFVFFATHLLTLSKLANVYPRVTNFSFEVLEIPLMEGGVQLQYTHRLIAGVTANQNYGLRFSESSDLPSSIVEEAREICEADPLTYEVPVQSRYHKLTREKLICKAKGVFERVYFLGQLRLETAKDIREFFWDAVEDLRTEDNGMAQATEDMEPASALHLLQNYASPAEQGEELLETDKGYDGEDVPMKMDDETPDDRSDFSFQSDTTLLLNTGSLTPAINSDSGDMEQDDESENADDDEDDDMDVFEEAMRRRESMYGTDTWHQSRRNFDCSAVQEVTPRPVWGLMQSTATSKPTRAHFSAGFPQNTVYSECCTGPGTSSAYADLPSNETPDFQRLLRNLYKSPEP